MTSIKKKKGLTMNAYQKFKNEIVEILDDIDTFMWAVDSRNDPNKTLRSEIEIFENASDRLKQAFEDLKTSEGDTLMKDIDYDGRLRD